MKSILIFIEGEGGGREGSSKRQHLDGAFRESWRQFLQPLADLAKNRRIRFRCVSGGSGATTFDKFAKPLPEQAGALRILLIDSEGPVNDVARPWGALPQLTRPQWATDGHCYLIVQCVETWLLADPDALRAHYDRPKPCFRPDRIRAWPALERIPKSTVQTALEEATAGCGAKAYGHADGNLLIAIVDRQKLMNLPSVARLFRDFGTKIAEYASGT